MIYKKVFLRVCLVSMVFVTMCVFRASVCEAKQWYDYYRKGQRALKEKNYQEAVELFRQCIELEPEPSPRKRAGFSSLAYYPYFSLGYAYLGLGEYEAAHQSCMKARELGVTPEKYIEQCLSITSNYVEIPTPTPTPTPTPYVPPEQPPRLQLSAPIPSSTEKNTIEIRGIVTDDTGLQEVKITVIGKYGFAQGMTIPLMEGKRETFAATRPLEEGQNTIRIEVRDNKGNLTKEEFLIVRNVTVAVAPTATPKSTPRPTPKPTPKPAPQSTAVPDNPPMIVVRSNPPQETTEKRLEIWGNVFDDLGIQDVKVSVQSRGEKGVIIADSKQLQDRFNATVDLKVGENTILVEAIDTGGQSASHRITVIRRSIPQVKSDATPVVSPEVDQHQGKVYAVIIGIGDYHDPKIPDLAYTVNDAQGLYEVLTDPNYGNVPENQITLLLNEQATYQNIKYALGRWILQYANPEDTVIIYYSGHGAPETGPLGGTSFYWVTHDANIDDLYSSAMNNNELASMLDRIRSDRVVTFLDSCYSAATVNRTKKTRDIITEIPLDKFLGKGRVAISASDGTQLSLELDEYKHGVFTYYLLEGLRGEADGRAGSEKNGIIDVDEVWNYVKYQVIQTARQAGNSQTPVLQGQLTAGIPLTFNQAYIREQNKKQQIAQKVDTLKQFMEDGKILPQHYNCAYKIVKSGEYNVWINSLLTGKIEPNVFNESFQCR